MSSKKLPEELGKMLDYAGSYAESLNSPSIHAEHLIKVMLDSSFEGQGFSRIMGMVQKVVGPVKIYRGLVKEVSDYCENNLKKAPSAMSSPILPPYVQEAFLASDIEAAIYNDVMPESIHLLLCLLKKPTSFILSLQAKEDYKFFTYENLSEYYKDKTSEENGDVAIEDPNPFAGLGAEAQKEETEDLEVEQKKKPVKKTPALDKFTLNLSKLDLENKLDPTIGRFSEVERVVQILSRKTKNNPVLLGEPGVGKTAIAEGLATRINKDEVPTILHGKTILSLDLVGVVAGTKFRGEFEERIKAILSELKENKDIILFIDEIHSIVGAGNSTGQMDAANILKPALARGEIQCIGATTFKEYKDSIEKDGALERRFQRVKVEPTSREDTISILSTLKGCYGNHHLVNYTEEAIEACVDMSIRYMADRFLPDKAIDLLDEAGARVNITNMKSPDGLEDLVKEIEEVKVKKDEAVISEFYEDAAEYKATQTLLEKKKQDLLDEAKKDRSLNRLQVTEENVAQVIALMTGIPVTKITREEKTKLKNLQNSLNRKVIDQKDPVEQVSKAIQRSRIGLCDPDKPVGSFLFCGPTGVGKTQLAKVLSEELFDIEGSLIRIDMSEFSHKHEISKLIGSAPGFVGYKEGGRLTEAVRKKPFSVVLLDEIEKAHEDVFNVFLQVLDDGILTDGLGRTVNFKNTVFIMTSNVGSRKAAEAGDSVGFSNSSSDSQKESRINSILDKELKKKFSPEFLNRLDGVVRFNYLSKEGISEILKLEIKKVEKRIEDKNYKVKFTKKALEFLADKGFQREFGARPLKRALQKYVEDLVTSEILNNDLKEGSTLTITHLSGADTLSKVVKRTKKKEKS